MGPRDVAARLERFGRLTPKALLLLSCLAAWCHDEPPPPCWCVPEVQSVQIVPGRLQVQPGSIFGVRARLIAADGEEIPEFFSYRPQWQVTPAGKVIVHRRDGHSITLEIPSDMIGAFTVSVEAVPGVSSVANGVVIVTAPASDHVVRDDHVSGEPLAVALADDGPSPTWDVVPVPFAGMGDLGNLGTPTGGIMVFSSDREMAYDAVSWSTAPAPDIIQYAPPVAPFVVQRVLQPPLTIPVTIWIDPSAGSDAWTATTAEAVGLVHMADASRSFRSRRTGVQFSVNDTYILDAGSIVEQHCGAWPASVQGLSTRDGLTSATFDPTPLTDNTNAIDIFVIDMGIATGFHCEEADGSPGHRIFVNAKYPLPTVLAHELGHALGLAHTTAMGQSNLMWEGDSDAPAPRRTHVSLGQACLMNQHNVVVARRVGASPPSCPPLTKDVP